MEGNSTITLAEVAKFAGESSQPIKEDQSTGRLSIVPLSHDGRDSLNMANEIAEQFESISVSPRFLRITPGPAIREQI